jgi:hypothetical protein
MEGEEVRKGKRFVPMITGRKLLFQTDTNGEIK